MNKIKPKTPKVFIIDDNIGNIEILNLLLGAQGFKIQFTTDPHKAVDLIEKEKPEVILLDIMMPEIDGIELCQRIKHRKEIKNIPIIFITALDDIESKLKAFESGGVDYITKPFIKDEVTARIKVHIELNRVIKKLELLSVTDELTGAYNRRFAYEIIDKQILLSKRQNATFAICFIDIDNLKTFNDKFGHEKGDILIISVAYSIINSIRRTDYLFRMGGDEFLILLNNTNKDDATRIIKKIKLGINNKKIEDMIFDFSYGIIEYTPGCNLSREELIAQSDSAMYKNKSEKKH